jgi:RsbT co-antagonist protein rsbRD N-terminal domain
MIKPVDSTVRPSKSGVAVMIETVADILEREIHPLIESWLTRVENEPDLIQIQLSHDERTGHLPHLIHDVITRLRLDSGTKAPISKAAAEHGDLRRKQGYTVAMMVEESRLLQVSIFTTLHKNATQLDFSALLPDVVTIADEVDAQLKEQMLRFMAADAAKKATGD